MADHNVTEKSDDAKKLKSVYSLVKLSTIECIHTNTPIECKCITTFAKITYHQFS
jgi:hypothetical protein